MKMNKDKSLDSISGWLLFFIITLIFINPAFNFIVLITDLSQYLFFDIISILAFIALSIFSGISLWRKESFALQFTKIFLIVSLITNLLTSILYWEFDFFSGILYFVIWIAYLYSSERVRNVYGNLRETKKGWEIWPIASILCAIFTPLYGIVFSIVSLRKILRNRKLKGLVISIVSIILSIITILFVLLYTIYITDFDVPEDVEISCHNLCLDVEGANLYKAEADFHGFLCSCLDEDYNILHSENLQAEEAVSRKRESSPIFRPRTEYSPSDIYKNSKEGLFIIETECHLKFSYPNFAVQYTYDRYSEEFDIMVEPLISKVEFEEPIVWSGSGFLLNGNIITNYHVIDCEEESIQEYVRELYSYIVDYHQNYYIDASYIEEIDYDIESKVDEIFDYIYREAISYYYEKFVIEDVLVARIAEFISENIVVEKTNRDINGYHESDGFRFPYRLNVLDFGGNFPDKDYAILSINTQRNSLPYNVDYDISIGEDVYVLGFPMIGLDSPETDEELLTWQVKREDPIITRGIISSLRDSRTGARYYVVDAAAYHGSSGGPAINSRGEVVGILTAGLEGLNYILPIYDIPMTD